jgi:hypothetical protein
LLFVQLWLPSFISITNNKISIPFSNIGFWVIILGCVVITALIVGSRPSFYLSSFSPVKVLKAGVHTGKAAALPRKTLEYYSSVVLSL